MSGEVRAVACNNHERVAIDKKKLKKEWVVQVGPFVEHTISIERKHRMSNIITLEIDGTPLVNSLSTDINTDNHESEWNCPFRLVGDKFLNFEMADARTMAQLGVKKMEEHVLPGGEHSAYPDKVSTPIRFTHDCMIQMKDINHIGQACLFIDGQEFTRLRPKHPPPANESAMNEVPAEVMTGTYGIVVPNMVVVNSVMRGLAWPVQSLEAAKNQLPSYDQMAPVAQDAKVKTAQVMRSLHEGVGNFMASMKGFKLNIPSCTAPQIDKSLEVAG